MEEAQPLLIVADAGPLIVLSRMGELALLPRVFGRVCITQVVHGEVFGGGSFPGQGAIADALSDWLYVEQVDLDDWAPLNPDIDPGEASSICLAERHDDSLLIIDDRAGRQEAAARGLRFVGLVGVLREAKLGGFIPLLRPLLEGLRGSGYFLSDELTQKVLTMVGEGEAASGE
jgi:predicted nucleic acid-binding protein